MRKPSNHRFLHSILCCITGIGGSVALAQHGFIPTHHFLPHIFCALQTVYMQPTTKLCSRCNTTKQLEEFGVNKKGVLAQCLACSAYNASRKAAEREET